MQAPKKWRRMMRRFLRPNLPDTPESLLNQAQTEMREAQARHRQRMVDAITTKNHLQQQINDMQARVENFASKATIADDRSDLELAQELRSNGEQHEKLLVLMQEKMAQTDAITEHLKQTFHLQNEVFSQKIAETMLLQVQYQMSVLQKKMTNALIGEASDTPAQRRAREKHRRILLPDVQKREKEFAVLVQTAESEIASLRVHIGRARSRSEEAAERVLQNDLEQQEATLLVLRDALDRARDVRERAERWVGAESKDSVVNGDANANATPPGKEKS